MAEEYGLASLLGGQPLPTDESGVGQLYGYQPSAEAPAAPTSRALRTPSGAMVQVPNKFTDEQAYELIRKQRPELFEIAKPSHKPIPHGHAARSADETVHPSFAQAQRGAYPPIDPAEAALNADVAMTPEEEQQIPRAYKFAPKPTPSPAEAFNRPAGQVDKQEALRAVLTGMPQVPAGEPIDPSRQGVGRALISGAPEILAGPLQTYGEHAEAMGLPGGQKALQYARELSAKSKELWQPTSDLQVAQARQQGVVPGAKAQVQQMAEEGAHFIGTWAPAIAAGFAEGIPAAVLGGAYTFSQIYKGISDRLDALHATPKGGILEKDINAALQTAVFSAIPAGMNKAGLDKIVGPSAAKIAEVFKTEGPEAAKAAAGSFLGNTFKSWAASTGTALPGLIATEEMTRYTTGEPSVSWEEVPGMVQSAIAMSGATAPLHGAGVTSRGRTVAENLAREKAREDARQQQMADDLQQEATRKWPEMRTEGQRRDQAQGTEHIVSPGITEPAPPTGEVNLLQPVDWHPVGDGYPNTNEGLKAFIAHHKAKLQSEVARRNPEVAAPIEAALVEANKRLLALSRTARRKAPPEPTGIPPSAETFPWPVEGAPKEEAVTPEAPAPTPEAPAPVEPVTPEAPVEETVRVYHGGKPPKDVGDLWVTTDLNDAKGWAARSKDMQLYHIDIPKSVWEQLSQGDIENGILPATRFVLPKEYAGQRKVLTETPWPVEALGLKPNAALTKRLAKLDMNNPEHIDAISDELNKTRVQIEPEKLAALSNHFDAIKPKEVPSAEQIPETGAPDGGSGAQPILREEGGDQTVSSKGVEPSGQGEQAPEGKAPEEVAPEEAEPLPELPPIESLPPEVQTYHRLISANMNLLAMQEKGGGAPAIAATRERIKHLHDLMNAEAEKVTAAKETPPEPEVPPKPEAPPEPEIKAEPVEPPQILKDHATDLGGEVAYHRGDTGLIRGYSVLTGEPVYAGVKGGTRTRIDIDHFTGKLFTPEELQHLREEKRRLVAEDEAAHAANPEGPFAGKESETLVSSPSVPKEIHEITKNWLNTLGIADRVHLATVEDAKAMKGKVNGPWASIPSQTLDDAFGSKRRLANGAYSIVYKPHARMSLNLETLGHEIGHIVQDVHFENAPAETQKAIKNAYHEWLSKTQGMDTAKELIDSTRGHTTAKFIDVAKGAKAATMDPYWTKFREWFADQTGRWAMSDARPVGTVERFFARLGRALRNFYQKNSQYLPHKTMADWLNSLGPSKVESAQRPAPENPIQAWSALREPGQPEWKNVGADVKQTWRDAFGDGAATKDLMDRLVGASASSEAQRQAGKVEPELRGFKDEESRSRVEPPEEERPELTKMEKPEGAFRKMWNAVAGTAKFVVDSEYRAGKYARARQELIAEGAGLEKVLRGKEMYDPELGIRADFIRNQVDSVGHLATVGVSKGFPYLEPKTGYTRVIDSPRFSLQKIQQDAAKLPLTTDYKGRRAEPLQVMGDILRIKMGEQELKEVAEARSKLARMERMDEASRNKKENKEAMQEMRDFIKDYEAGRGKEQLVRDEDIMWANQLLARTPKAQDIVDRWQGLNENLLDYAVATNWLAKDTAERWKDRWYAPMYKSIEDIEAGRNMPSFPGGGPRAVGKVKGKKGSKQTVNIWENLARHYTYMLGNSMTNQAKVASYRQLERQGLAQRTSPEDKSANAVKMNMEGKPFSYKVFDEDAFRSLTMANMQHSWLVDLAAAPARWVRNTSLMQPGFWYRTVIRDPVAANLLTTGRAHPWGPFRAIPITPMHTIYEIGKMAADVNKAAKELREYGTTGYYGSQASVENFAQGLAGSSLMKKMGERVHKIHAAMDDATRVVIYKAAKAEAKRDGITDPQVINDIAAIKAQEFTNFATRGHSQWIRQYGRITPFFHAQLAGLDKVIRQASGYGQAPKDAARAKSNFITGAALMSGMTMAYTFAMLHDKRYRDLPIRDWTNNFIIYDDPDENGDAHGHKLPIPQEVGFMFKIIPELTMRYAMGLSDDAEAKKAFNSTFLDLMVPPGTLEGPTPPFLRGWQMMQTGVEPHSGLPIESQYEAGLLPEDREKRASFFGRQIREALGDMGGDLSPDKVDALMRTLFSTAYDYGAMTAEMMWDAHTGKRGLFELPFDKDFTERYPIAKDLYTNPRTISAVPKFYEMAKPIYMTMNSQNKAAFEGDIERFNEITNDPDMRKRLEAHPSVVDIKRQINDIERALTTLEHDKRFNEPQKRKIYWDNIKKRNELARKGFELISSVLKSDPHAERDIKAGEKWHLDSSGSDFDQMELPE